MDRLTGRLPDRPMTAVVVRAQAANDDPDVLGFVMAFPDGTKLQAAAHVPAEGYLDPESIPRAMAAKFLDALIRKGNLRTADGTNWPSVAAAIQREIFAFNRERRDRFQNARAVMVQ